jgi:two-component system sensor histidine kinase DesK
VIASLLQLVPGRAGALLAAAPLAGTVATAVVDPVVAPTLANGLVEGFYWLVGLGIGGFAMYGSARLVQVLDELHATRAELAEAAVGRERLRVSRDLHDLLGHALSAVSLKGDLALALLHRDPAAARAEITGLTDVARGALRDVRAITSGRHSVSLRSEVDGAVRLLAAAGIATRVDLDPADPPRAMQPLLAWAVREGVTNVLRHSEATCCTITLARRDGRVRLEIANDGAHPPGPAGGTGLAGVVARAHAARGTAVAERTGDRFRLVVDVPEDTP